MAALAYVRRMRRMNLTGKATAGQPASASLGDGLGTAWGLNWADKTFGQGLSSLTKGARALFASRAQHASLIGTSGLPVLLIFCCMRSTARACCSRWLASAKHIGAVKFANLSSACPPSEVCLPG